MAHRIDGDRVICTASATAQALSKILTDRDIAVALDRASLVDMFGQHTAIVRVTVDSTQGPRSLTGFGAAEPDLVRGAALAVLNATNRFLDYELAVD